MREQITTASAAKLLGVTPSTISRMVARGELTPLVKMPGRRGAFLFDRADIERLVRSKERTA